MRRVFPWILLPALLAVPLDGAAGVILDPKPAPEWKVSRWINGDPGPLSSQKGRIVLIDFFQLWCPGCQAFSVPLFNRWAEKYAGREDIVVVSIHTVFEGHDEQTPQRLQEFIAARKITHPVGIDAYDAPSDETPVTMKRYETGGTPHVAIVDKDGQLRFSHFGRFDPDTIEAFIERLLKESETTSFMTKTTSSKPASGSKPKADRRGPSKRSAPGRRAGKTPRTEKQPDTKPDADLSGTYMVQLEQTQKSCGDLLPPVQMRVDLVVMQSEITARFSKDFNGVRQMLLDYDARTGRVSARTSKKLTVGKAEMNVELELDGQIGAGDPAEIEYEARMTQTAEDGSVNCAIEAQGRGEKLKR